MSTQNDTARAFKALHKPGDPLVLTNVWDAITANAVASLPATKALATASYAIAAAAGLSDDELTLEVNLRAVSAIAKVAKAHNLPLTADFQDGFGDQLDEGVRSVIKLGAVGINLEDFSRELGGLYPVAEAQERIRRVLAVAGEEGVPDFVVNARTDALFAGQNVDEAVQRGKAYLQAGAANVFIWGGPSRKGWSRGEVEKATEALEGKLNVILVRMKPDGLSVKELAEMGVARVSVGPQLMLMTAGSVGDAAAKILAGEGV
ncbi:PEP phosphonomutase-like protein [Cucurbitaria berberidis CBS 394.84]|uniref:PEP phosphonomutase-like protein n=1 Tax=Cucurbitaria berberidis CBS 394.84 TaxID=1168544 RepID=A0A9P4GJU4_9PLEO|nr:PEP phosphonomutase-like protein [Cucurbitaria berberidis CBS 394.84]KAF1846706.1 PEP phosphonomutase-like protein [Cucurbitaria berberidis CBS 394.84]